MVGGASQAHTAACIGRTALGVMRPLCSFGRFYLVVFGCVFSSVLMARGGAYLRSSASIFRLRRRFRASDGRRRVFRRKTGYLFVDALFYNKDQQTTNLKTALLFS